LNIVVARDVVLKLLHLIRHCAGGGPQSVNLQNGKESEFLTAAVS